MRGKREVIECVTGAISQDDCDLSTLQYANSDGSGNLSTTYDVFAAAASTGPSSRTCNCAVAENRNGSGQSAVVSQREMRRVPAAHSVHAAAGWCGR